MYWASSGHRVSIDSPARRLQLGMSTPSTGFRYSLLGQRRRHVRGAGDLLGQIVGDDRPAVEPHDDRGDSKSDHNSAAEAGPLQKSLHRGRCFGLALLRPASGCDRGHVPSGIVGPLYGNKSSGSALLCHQASPEVVRVSGTGCGLIRHCAAAEALNLRNNAMSSATFSSMSSGCRSRPSPWRCCLPVVRCGGQEQR